MRALLLSAVAAVLLAPAAAYGQTPSCTYGGCEETTGCGTAGRRYPTNAPCLGAPFLVCSAPGCPACTYSSCSATVCNATGTQVANNQPCIGETSLTCTAPACPACVYSACDAVCGGGYQVALNQPCTGSANPTCNLQACGNGDFNGDGLVDEADRDLLVQAMGSSVTDSRYLAAADRDSDAKITLVDYQFWIGDYRAFLAEQAAADPPPAPGAPSGADGPEPVPVMGRSGLGLLLLTIIGCVVYWRAKERSRA